MSILGFVMSLEAHYVCGVKHDFQYVALVSFNVW